MFISFLSSISKVAIVAFLFTFVAILIELFLISKKDKKKSEKKDVILPDFKESSFKSNDTVSNVPLPVKKVAVAKSSKQISAKYVVGLVGLCALVFIGIAASIMFKGSPEEELVEQIPIPTSVVRPSVHTPTISQGVDDDTVELLDFEEEGSSDEAGLLAQAPSPTAIISLPTTVPTIQSNISPTVTPMVLRSLTVTPTTPSPTKITSLTKSASPTLLQTGTSYNAGLFAAVLSFALIAFAFMF